MKRFVFLTMAAGLLFQAGCHRKAVTPPLPPPLPPVVEKTFGDVEMDGSGLALQYKGMRILIDPTPSLLSAQGGVADFVLFTRAAAIPAGGFRPDQKVIGPGDGNAAATRAGLARYKVMAGGQRLMLSKDQAFAFVGGMKGRGAAGETVNGYLLEFDNGRNIVVVGSFADASPVREFVYTLRDDGKEVQLGFFSIPAPGGENGAAELAGLLQPRLAVFTGGQKADSAALKAGLEAQIFNGEWRLAGPRERVAF